MKFLSKQGLYSIKLGRLVILAGAFLSCWGTAMPAQAALEWSLGNDPHNDSTASDGSDEFEIYGGGYAQDDDFVYFGLDTNMAVTGVNTGTNVGGYYVGDGNIGWGDFFFDPLTANGGGTFNDGLATGRTIGIKFSPNNDSGVSAQGVYYGATGGHVADENAGYANLASHNFYVGGRSQLGYLSPDDPYYVGNGYGTKTSNVMARGMYQGEVSLLNRQTLSDLGFGTMFGRNSFGLKVAKSLLPTGDFVATILQECINEGFAIHGDITPPQPPESPQPVPEASSLVALLSLAMGMGLASLSKAVNL
jgi:hypothetical protein